MGMKSECKEKKTEQSIAAAGPKAGLNPSGMVPPVLKFASVLFGLWGSRSGTSFRCGGCFAVFAIIVYQSQGFILGHLNVYQLDSFSSASTFFT
jgi:hypothetical protein